MRRSKRSATETSYWTSVYFDTDKLKLHKNGFSLRIRRIGDRHVQTIKRGGNTAVLERDEWESETEGELPDFKAARKTPLRPRSCPRR